jgi:CheY-specific phosphatase CheX
MSSSINPKIRDEVLKAYEKGWESALVKAVEDAIVGSTGLELNLIKTESLSQAPLASRTGFQVSGIIGLNAGEIVGNICVMFSKEAILEIAETAYCQSFTKIEGPVLDCVGEITNLVHGIFKRQISEKGYFLKISLPNVILGEHQVVSLVATKYFRAEYQLASQKRIDVSMTIDLGSD